MIVESKRKYCTSTYVKILRDDETMTIEKRTLIKLQITVKEMECSYILLLIEFFDEANILKAKSFANFSGLKVYKRGK